MAKTLFKVVGEGGVNSFEIVDNAGAMQIKIDGTQTASVADATGTADSITRINLIIDALETAGILAPA
jgi:hypothetical protein